MKYIVWIKLSAPSCRDLRSKHILEWSANIMLNILRWLFYYNKTQALFWICQNVLYECGDLDHYLTIGRLLTEETNKRRTVDTHLEWDQSILALRRILLCKRELSKEQKDKLKAELFLSWVGLHIQTVRKSTTFLLLGKCKSLGKICITDLLFSAAGGR